jgi:hypothetical protein
MFKNIIRHHLKGLFKQQTRFFSPRMLGGTGNIITRVDGVGLDNLRDLYDSLKEEGDRKSKNTQKSKDQFDDDKNLIIINTENTDIDFDKKITVNEIDWEKSNLKEYKIVFNESMVGEGERDLGYITFDEDGKSREIPTYQEFQEEVKSKKRSGIENLESNILFDEKKPEMAVVTTKSYFVFPEQKDYAMKYYEILTSKGKITQDDLVELEKLRPKHLAKYNSKPGSYYVYKNFTEALEEIRLYTEEIKPELRDSELQLRLVINIDSERADHCIQAELKGEIMTLQRENIISLGNLGQSDVEIKKAIKGILDNVYAVRPKSVTGRYFLSASLLVGEKEFYVDVIKSAKSRNKN